MCHRRTILITKRLLLLCTFPLIWEIGWAGLPQCRRCDWLELYNPTNKEIVLEGWSLFINNKRVPLKGTIPPFGFYLLSNNTTKNRKLLKADLYFPGYLSNKGATLRLVSLEGKTLEVLDFSQGWPAGSQKKVKSAERRFCEIAGNKPGNWHTSLFSPGTPKSPNSPGEKRFLNLAQIKLPSPTLFLLSFLSLAFLGFSFWDKKPWKWYSELESELKKEVREKALAQKENPENQTALLGQKESQRKRDL